MIRIPLPELSERKDDIILLVESFINKHCQKFGIPHKKVSEEAKSYFLEYSWPGNVRELENVTEGIITFALDDEVIEPRHLPKELKENKREKSNLKKITTIEAAEKEAIKNALYRTANNITEAAELLGVSRATLYNKLNKYDISHRE